MKRIRKVHTPAPMCTMGSREKLCFSCALVSPFISCNNNRLHLQQQENMLKSRAHPKNKHPFKDNNNKLNIQTNTHFEPYESWCIACSCAICSLNETMCCKLECKPLFQDSFRQYLHTATHHHKCKVVLTCQLMTFRH